MSVNQNAGATASGNTGTNPSAGQGRLRVTLLEKRSLMRRLVLPEKPEGRFAFTNPDGSAGDIPLYFLPAGGKWAAYADRARGRGWAFRRSGAAPVYHVVLQDSMLLEFSGNGRRCMMHVENVIPGDDTLVPYSLNPSAEIWIGRSPECGICCESSLLSRRHARLFQKDGQWVISDENSTNGVWLNGSRMQGSVLLSPGDTVYLLGMVLVMGVGYVGINSLGKHYTFNNAQIRPLKDVPKLPFAPPSPEQSGELLYDRKPRRIYKLEKEPMSVELPPMRMNADKTPLMLRVGSTVMSAGRSMITGNILSGLASLLMPLATNGYTESDRRNYEERRSKFYYEYLQRIRRAVSEELQQEKQYLNQMYPPFSEALAFPVRQDRLWERRSVDDDFLRIRIGTGDIPMIREIEFPDPQREMDADPLLDSLQQLKDEKRVIPGGPALLDLTRSPVTSVTGSRSGVIRFVRDLVMQLALTHSYDEVKIVLLADREEISAVADFRWLPHLWSNDRQTRFLADSKADAGVIGRYLADRLGSEGEEEKKKPRDLTREPAWVIIALSKPLLDCIEILKDELQAKEFNGVSVVSAFDPPMKEARQLITMQDSSGVLADLDQSKEEDQSFSLEQVPEDTVSRAIRLMNHTAVRQVTSFSLPRTFTFLEMFNAGRVEHLSPLSRWKASNPVKSLAAPVGIGTDGALLSLDLHQKYEGPHGLVAGMTGSGKSEWIITYILSMAVNYSPEEVAFILIDYKGGGLTTAFDDPDRDILLPHIAGTITNLDGAAVNRAMVSISAELKRRQRLFNQAKSRNDEGTMDIYDYQRLYRAGKVSDPLPHLFIISDEFAELRTQQPEFLDELISTARIGRSLGVHLILATQKPAGVVNDQIWSNTRFRVCLKVQDRSDSMDMLHRPEAAELVETGRFYLQVGYNEYFTMGQSAWTGAAYQPKDEAGQEIDDAVEFIDNPGRIILKKKPQRTAPDSGQKQLTAVVRFLSDLAKREHIRTRALWMPPLPNVLDWEKTCASVACPPLTARLGILDDPELQNQEPFLLDAAEMHNLLIIGESGSGKSTLLRTLLYSLVASAAPGQLGFYLLDLSGGALAPFRNAPHCGAYLSESDEESLSRLLQLLRDTIAERRALFRREGVTDWNVYRRTRPLPLILMAIDGFHNLSVFSRPDDLRMELQGLMRESVPYGIRFVITANHLNEVSIRIQQEADARLALKVKDKYDLSDILGARCAAVQANVPGRAVGLSGGRPLEIQIAVPLSEEPEETRLSALADRLRAAGGAGAKPCIRVLPMARDGETYEELCRSFDPGRIALGYETGSLKQVAIPLKQLNSASVYLGTPNEAGSVWKNLLAAAAYNGMKTLIFPRSSHSFFTEAVLPPDTVVFPCTAEGLSRLDSAIIGQALAQNEFRDEFCRINGIPDDAPGRAVKARHYIYEHSQPVMVMIERMADLISLIDPVRDKEQEEEFTLLFERNEGYNIHYFAGFCPDDSAAVTRSGVLRAYNQANFSLLFGGNLDQQRMVNLPLSLRSGVLPAGRFLMYYRDKLHTLQMPVSSAEEQSELSDPDEAPIL